MGRKREEKKAVQEKLKIEAEEQALNKEEKMINSGEEKLKKTKEIAEGRIFYQNDGNNGKRIKREIEDFKKNVNQSELAEDKIIVQRFNDIIKHALKKQNMKNELKEVDQ